GRPQRALRDQASLHPRPPLRDPERRRHPREETARRDRGRRAGSLPAALGLPVRGEVRHEAGGTRASVHRGGAGARRPRGRSPGALLATSPSRIGGRRGRVNETTGGEDAVDNLLEVRDLKTFFYRRGRFGVLRPDDYVAAVDGVSLSVQEGETLGIVGESGCGKTTLGRTILRLLPATSGAVHFRGEDLLRLTGHALRAKRREMQMIFQALDAALN